jgi:hypothetical protein
MPVTDLIVYPSCRFADNLYPVKHRALQELVSVEASAIILNVAPDPIDRVAPSMSARRSLETAT